MAADLDEQVAAFRHRRLDEAGPFTFVTADALTIKVRENKQVVKASVLLATGVNGDAHREVLGMQVATSETTASWNTFFADLVARGLGGVRPPLPRTRSPGPRRVENHRRLRGAARVRRAHPRALRRRPLHSRYQRGRIRQRSQPRRRQLLRTPRRNQRRALKRQCRYAEPVVGTAPTREWQERRGTGHSLA